MTPLKDNLIVKRIEEENTTDSGIILKSKNGPDKCKVVAVGPEVKYILVNEILLIDWNKAKKIDDMTYTINIENVVGVFD